MLVQLQHHLISCCRSLQSSVAAPSTLLLVLDKHLKRICINRNTGSTAEDYSLIILYDLETFLDIHCVYLRYLGLKVSHLGVHNKATVMTEIAHPASSARLLVPSVPWTVSVPPSKHTKGDLMGHQVLNRLESQLWLNAENVMMNRLLSAEHALQEKGVGNRQQRCSAEETVLWKQLQDIQR